MNVYIKKKNNELYHYGVKGMKWGVRRYQNKDGSLTALGKQRITNNGSYRLSKYTSPYREELKSEIMSSIATIIPGVNIAYALKYAKDVYSYNIDRKDYTEKEGSYEKLSELKKKTSPTDISDDLQNANPRIGKQAGKVNNCAFCTVAMEMRQRGYDVQARSKAQGAVVEELYPTMFKNFKMEYPRITRLAGESRKNYVNRSYDNLCNQIEKYGNGARGYVSIGWEKSYSGHAMYWKVENNRVNFYDGQSGKANPEKLFALADPARHSYARLDNLKVLESVTEAVVSKKSEGEK